MKQTFLRPEEQRFTATSPEVSAFALTEDKRILIIGTSQSEANIFVWELSTNMMLSRLIIPNCCQILYMKAAHDSKHLIIIVSFRHLPKFSNLGSLSRLPLSDYDG